MEPTHEGEGSLAPARPGISAAFAGRLAHEVRSPIGVVSQALAELDRSSDLPRSASVYLELARRSTARVLRMAERLEMVAAVLEGTFVEVRATTRLSRVLSPAIDGAVASSGRQDLQVTFELPEALVEARVPRPHLVRFALEELVHNAVRHAASAASVSVGSDGDLVVVAIAHDGRALQDQPRSFEPRSGSGCGLGIGLWLAHALAEHFGGRVWIDGEATHLSFPRKA